MNKIYGNVQLFATMEKMIHGKTGSLFVSLSLSLCLSHTHTHTALHDGETLCSEAASVDIHYSLYYTVLQLFFYFYTFLILL